MFGKLTCVNGMVKTEEKRLALSFVVRYGLQITGAEILAKVKAVKEGWHITESTASDGYNLENTHPVAQALRRAYTLFRAMTVTVKKCRQAHMQDI